MGFITYDLVFMGLFILFVIVFLSTRKKGLQREGILFLYRTQFGIKFIDNFARRFEKFLNPLRYVVIASGYILMVSMIYFFTNSVYLYVKYPLIAEQIKTPPIAPLIPYFPQLFGLESLLPPLYFTYFLIALAIVAISHEASHGIFARLEKFKVRSTGFTFLGPFLGAFVEPDEKQMAKAKKLPQLSVWAAGTFANVIMTLIFGLLLLFFFTSSFTPAGIQFNTYSLSTIQTTDSYSVENSSLSQSILQVKTFDNKIYFIDAEAYQKSIRNNVSQLIVFEDSPAFRAQLRGAITEIDDKKITSYEELTQALQSYKPGETIKIKTAILKPGQGTVAETKDYEIKLGEKDNKAFLGIGFFPQTINGLIGKFYYNTFAQIKKPLIFYESSLGDFGWFVYYLLWWIVVINLLVALFNMLPLWILDGGHFFYLTVLGITKSENVAKKSYKTITYFLLILIVLMMFRWIFVFF